MAVFNEPKYLEILPLRNCNGDEKVTCIRPFLLDKVTFDKHVSVLKRFDKESVSNIFTFIVVLFLNVRSYKYMYYFAYWNITHNLLKCYNIGHVAGMNRT